MSGLASSKKSCLLFLESCKIPRQSHKGKKIFLRAKEESQTCRTVEGLAQGHTQVTAGAGLRQSPPSPGCAVLPSLRPTQSKANQDKKMIMLRKLSLILGIPAPPDNDPGSKNLFLKLYRKRFFLDCLVEFITNTTPASLGFSSPK